MFWSVLTEELHRAWQQRNVFWLSAPTVSLSLFSSFISSSCIWFLKLQLNFLDCSFLLWKSSVASLTPTKFDSGGDSRVWVNWLLRHLVPLVCILHLLSQDLVPVVTAELYSSICCYGVWFHYIGWVQLRLQRFVPLVLSWFGSFIKSYRVWFHYIVWVHWLIQSLVPLALSEFGFSISFYIGWLHFIFWVHWLLWFSFSLVP